jgi:hypothetical protein
MGNRPVRSAADHSLRWVVRAREEKVGKEDWMSARRGLMRGNIAEGVAGPRQEGETVFRDEAIPFSQVVQVPERSRERLGGVFGDKFGSKEGMPWIKPFVRALTKVERAGEPKARRH